jgi:hypothetical protein
MHQHCIPAFSHASAVQVPVVREHQALEQLHCCVHVHECSLNDAHHMQPAWEAWWAGTVPTGRFCAAACQQQARITHCDTR